MNEKIKKILKVINDMDDLTFVVSALATYLCFEFCVAIIIMAINPNVFELTPLPTWLLSIIWNPLLIALEEEACYRFVPLTLALKSWGKGWKTIVVALSASLVFGIIHMNYQNLVLQTIFSFFLSMVFIRLSKNNQSWFRAYVGVVFIHAMSDFGSLYGILKI